MSIRTSPWPAGVPCWTDLVTPDVDGARSFYGSVLGWSFEDTPDGFGGYVIAQVDGQPAAGIGPLPQEGHPPAWTLYLASDDVDATAVRIGDSGGSVLMAPGDVGPVGRMCLAADPSGAVFGVWQHGTSIGANHVNAAGGLVWEDLRSSDPQVAWPFYEAVFGYRLDALPEAGGDYKVFSLPGEQAPLGGMGGTFGAGPSRWVVYFGVHDADAAVAAAEAAGGRALAPAYDSPYGRMASVADPAGASFTVITVDESRMPDRSG